MLILEHSGPDSTDAALAGMGSAMLLQRQRRLPAALTLADSLLAVHAGHTIADDLLMLRARVLHDMRRSTEARDAFVKLGRAHPNSYYAVQALLMAAEIQETELQDPDGALEVYTDLLRRYGTSLHAPEIRRRILTLRSSGV